MKLVSYIAIATVAVSSGLIAPSAEAQNLTGFEVPAEFPPASFTGRQYVDSRGCVYVRAGIDGNVSWVPRVARDRRVICGFQPSLTSQVAKADAPAAPAPAKPAEKPAAAASVAEPAPAAQVAQVKAKPQATPAQPSAQTVRVTPTVAAKPVKVVTAAQPQVAAKPATIAPRVSTCRGASEMSRRYLTAPSGIDVRCGPQATPHVTLVQGGDARTVSNTVSTTQVRVATAAPTTAQPVPLKRTNVVPTAATQTRVVPRHVYENRVASTQGVYIPEGYKPVWEDDRLNPNRAYQTFAGRAQMELYWTNTVPRMLVERKTGRDARYLFPELQYPYTSLEQQQAARSATISTKGRVAQTETGRSRLSKHDAQSSMAERAQTYRPSATILTRSATAPLAPASHRYVQVGRFGDPAQAARAAQHLANSGLPTKLGRGGSTGIVIVGPYQDQTRLMSALNRVRAMGFGGATLRK